MFLNIQVGWMKCIACSDNKRNPGMMWLGGNDYVQCPACKGNGEVPRYKQLDPRTGKEIDYERIGRHGS